MTDYLTGTLPGGTAEFQRHPALCQEENSKASSWHGSQEGQNEKQDVVRVRSNPKESISKHPQSQKRSGIFPKSKSKIYNIKISIT